MTIVIKITTGIKIERGIIMMIVIIMIIVTIITIMIVIIIVIIIIKTKNNDSNDSYTINDNEYVMYVQFELNKSRVRIGPKREVDPHNSDRYNAY